MSRVRFDAFEVDDAAGELKRGADLVPIQDLPLRLLLILLEQPRSVVSRDQLRQRLWGDTVVDFDAGLNTAVRKLREALGDSADAPRLLATVPRRGYRLQADVEPIVEPAQTTGAQETLSIRLPIPDAGNDRAVVGAGPGSRARSIAWWLAAAAVVALPLVWLAHTPSKSSRRLLVVPFQSVVADQALADELTAELISRVARIAPSRFEVLGPLTSRRYRSMTDA